MGGYLRGQDRNSSSLYNINLGTSGVLPSLLALCSTGRGVLQYRRYKTEQKSAQKNTQK